MGLIVPTEVEAIFHGADDPATRLDENQISADLMRVRKNLPTTSADQQRGAFAEIAAWHFTRSDDGDAEPWGLYWGPVASGVLADGKTSFYSPNVAELDDDILAYWIDRASSAKHPAISARYADLAWTIGGYLRRPQERRPECMAPLASIDVPVSLAHGAIDNYLDTVEWDLAKDEYHAWFYLARAVELVVSLKDPVRIGRAKSVLFGYHGKLVGAQERFMWWRVDDIVTRFEKVLNLDASETSALQGTLRKALDESSDATNEDAFDPHKATAAADRLIKRLGTNKVEIQAAIKQAGEAFEKAAENAKGLLAVSWLEDLIPRYRDVGLNADAVRIEQTIRARSEEAMSEMKHISVPLNIPEKEIHDWADKIAGSSLTEALGRIAVAGMTKEETIRQSVNASRDHAPLASQIAVVIMSHDGFTEATIGSVEDDIEGRSFKEAADRFNFEAPFLYVLFNRIREKHGLDIEQLLDHVRKSPFFPAHREPLLRDGLAAWFDDDPVKAIHLLVPQIEAACRDLLASAGVSVRKPNPRVSGSRVIGLGDVLGSKVFKQGGMKDVGFHLRALYTDPRGINLRNKLAHGLAHGGILGMGVANLVVHSILMIAALSIKHKQP